MHEQTFTVSGMTCGHCVAAVSEELSKLPGVTDVAVVLDGGNVTVRSETLLDDEAVRDAVDEAGYTLVS
jgi:copper chaperone